jgi:hypothetical protein
LKCAVVEKNASADRVNFLKTLLEFNNYKVVVVASPPPKAAAPVSTLDTEEQTAPAAPVNFTIGVTDVTFNATNAIFGRLLRTPDKHVVTLAYWRQEEPVAKDDVPYYEKK